MPPKEWIHQPVGKSRGMAMHESQPLIEMQITRSLSFKIIIKIMKDRFSITDNSFNEENLYLLGTREQSLFKSR